MVHLALSKHFLVLLLIAIVVRACAARKLDRGSDGLHMTIRTGAKQSNMGTDKNHEHESVSTLNPSFRQIGNLPIPKNLTNQMSNPSTSSSGLGWGAGGPGAGGGGGYATGGGAASGGGGGTTKGGSGGGSGVSSGGRGSGQGCTTGMCAGGTAVGAYDPTQNGTERRGANGFGFGSGSPGKGGGGGLGVGGGSGAGGGGGDKFGGTGGGSAAAAGAGSVGSGRTNTTEGFGAVTGTGYTGPLPSQKAQMSQLKGKMQPPRKMQPPQKMPTAQVPKFKVVRGQQGAPRQAKVAVTAVPVPQAVSVQGRSP